ncbi:MAG: hypothetical protein ABR511_08090 [Acidimicrobiales bacterium]
MVGHWATSPLGPITDLMWASPDGERLLVAPSAEVAAFVSAVYGFDRTVVSPLHAGTDGGRWPSAGVAPTVHSLHVTAPDLGLDLRLEAGAGWRIPFPRPAWFTRWVEGPVARALLGVRTYGVSPTGVREWYRTDVYRRVTAGRATVGGRDLGPLGPVRPAVGFGFSEPPRRPSLVAVRPLLWDPSGALDRLLAASPRPRPGPG